MLRYHRLKLPILTIVLGAVALPVCHGAKPESKGKQETVGVTEIHDDSSLGIASVDGQGVFDDVILGDGWIYTFTNERSLMFDFSVPISDPASTVIPPGVDPDTGVGYFDNVKVQFWNPIGQGETVDVFVLVSFDTPDRRWLFYFPVDDPALSTSASMFDDDNDGTIDRIELDGPTAVGEMRVANRIGKNNNDAYVPAGDFFMPLALTVYLTHP